MPRIVILMRHAKSSWKETGLSDIERPLNKRGLRIAPLMGEWLRSHRFEIEKCLCSTARRTRHTLECVQVGYDRQIPTEYSEKLYASSPHEIVRHLQELENEFQTVLVIAHNPGLETLVERWSGITRSFPTAAIAVFSFEELKDWSAISIESKPLEIQFQIPSQLQ
ncbi:SixA phosphatase family protein [Rubinisphaera italica]|uniref:Phosphohistidine phosphatase SixA n=1 Tax=Rubinisphaera italica TaxID=2527969 RepID=A0A5C5XDK3_9PLAN|nr:histidine phosphatase family protein [Rubinisphaera italica]TWT61187.1 Phosphohistidine phosphatase SixA [Rubinisphaera italica]